jgi:hypothetical protein
VNGMVSRVANAGRTSRMCVRCMMSSPLQHLRRGELIMRPHVLHDVRPRQNIEWNPINLENHFRSNVILAARAKHASHESVRRTTPLRKTLWVQP